MKKSIYRLIIMIVAVSMIFTACTLDSKTDKVATVEFDATNAPATRSITSAVQTLDPAKYFWTYTAIKNDSTDLTTGQTTEETAVRTDGAKGLGTVGPFSLGNWRIGLKAYEALVDGVYVGLAYEGEGTGTIKSGAENRITIKVYNSVSSEEGYVYIPRRIGVETSNGEVSPNEMHTTLHVDFGQDGVSLDPQPKLVTKDLNKEKLSTNTYKVAPGDYEVYVTYTNDDMNDELIAEDAAFFTVYPHVVTEIVGSLTEVNDEATFDPELGVKTVEKQFEITQNEGQTEHVLDIAAAPVAGDGVEENNTSIAVPVGGLENDVPADVKVSSYTSVAAVKNPVFVAKEGEVAVGALDITIKQNSVEKTDFKANPLTVTTYIAPNLETENVKIYCSNPEEEQPVLKSYDPASGKLVFTTTHLSSFFATVTGYDAWNITQNKYIKVLDAYDKGYNVNDVIILLRDTAPTSEFIITRSLTVDLNGYTITPNLQGKANNVFQVKADLTVKDSSNGQGCINNTKAPRVFCIYPGAKVVVEGGKITTSTQFMDFQKDERAKTYSLEIKEGAVIESNGNTPMISNHEPMSKFVVNISGGQISSPNAPVYQNWGTSAVSCDEITVTGNPVINGQFAYLPSGGTFKISGGTFTNDTNIIYQKAGNLEITGGKFVTTSNEATWSYNGSGHSKTGDAIVSEANNYGGHGEPTVNIQGAEFVTDPTRYGVLLLDHPAGNHSVGGSVASEIKSERFDVTESTDPIELTKPVQDPVV